MLPYDEESLRKPFTDLCKRRFLWYFESYLNTVDAEAKKVTPNQKFSKMPFEYHVNSMDGHFNYPELERRLFAVKDAILQETRNWAVEGRQASETEKSIAVNLRHQYEQVVEGFKSQKNYTVDLTLVDDNPFVWELTCFGRPMTQLDGGIFKIRIWLSTRFPEEQPRPFMQPPLFHHRVSKEGVICYFPRKSEDIHCHIELLWSNPEGRRKYNRALRLSVERSAE